MCIFDKWDGTNIKAFLQAATCLVNHNLIAKKSRQSCPTEQQSEAGLLDQRLDLLTPDPMTGKLLEMRLVLRERKT